MKKAPILLVFGAFAALFVALYLPALGGKVLAARDLFRIFIPEATLVQEALFEGRLPLWNPYARLGQPLWAMPQAQVTYPLHLALLVVSSPVRVMTLQQLAHVLIAFFGTYLCARRLGAARLGAGIGAIAAALSVLATNLAIVPNMAGAFAWTGFILAAADGLGRAPSPRRAALLSLALSMSLLNASPEALLWQVPLAAVCLVRSRALHRRTIALFVTAGLFALLLCAASLVPAAELFRLSERSADAGSALYWSTWSSEPRTLLTFASLGADLPRGDYDDTQNLVRTLFLGVPVLSLAALSLLGRRRRWLKVFAAVGLLFTVLSLGGFLGPFGAVLGLPPFSFFRYPVKYALGGAFVLCVLASLGVTRLQSVLRRSPSARGRLVHTMAPIAGALLATLFLLAMLGKAERAPLIGLGLATATVLALLIVWTHSRRVALGTFAIFFAELLVAHALDGGQAWFDAAELQKPSPLAALLRQHGVVRISTEVDLEGPPDEARDHRFVERSRQILAPMRFIEEHLHGVDGQGAPILKAYAQLHRRDDFASHVVARAELDPGPNFKPIARHEDLVIYEHLHARPRVFISHHAQTVSSAESSARREEREVRTGQRVLLAEGGVPIAAAGCTTSMARVREESPETLFLEVDACAEGYLVVADMDYPGWSATVDGEGAPIIQANGFMRAVKVPPGRHEVRFSFGSPSVRVGLTGSAIGLFAVGAALFWPPPSRRKHSAQP